MADTATESTPSARPPMPDEAAYKKALAAAEAELKAVQEKQKKIKAQLDLAHPNRNKDDPSPVQKRRQELQAELSEIRKQQAGGKDARSSKQEQIKRLEEKNRTLIAEQKTARAKVPYKSVDDIDRQIQALDAQVNSGKMKLVDEKKALAEISNLRKVRKNFSQFDDGQKQIDDNRAKIKDLRDGMDNPEQRAFSERYAKAKAELDAIHAEADEVYKNRSSLRDELSRLKAEHDDKYRAFKKVGDDFHGARKAAKRFEFEQRERARERQQAEYERHRLEKRRAEAERMLAEAADPAYLDDIRRANSLLQFLDPGAAAVEKAPLLEDRGFGAQAQRKVDDAGIKGTRLVSKKDRDDDYLPAVKKGAKGKKGGVAAGAASSNKGFNCPPSVVEDCAAMGIDPPMSQADVAAVADKVRAKLQHWKDDQASQTQKNIEKAKARLAEMEEAEAKAENGVNGDGKADGKVAEVTEKLKDAKVEDKKAKAEAAA